MTALFQGDVIIIRHTVITDHAKSFLQHQLRQMKSDETGSSCDQDRAHFNLCKKKTAVIAAVFKEQTVQVNAAYSNPFGNGCSFAVLIRRNHIVSIVEVMTINSE